MKFINLFLMSRIGKVPVKILSGVTVELRNGVVFVKGPKGELNFEYHSLMRLKVEGDEVQVYRPNDDKLSKSLHGLTRSLVDNMITGVSKGFERRLEIHGVGYRAQISGSKINFSLGFSHPVEMNAPEGLSVAMDEKNKNEIIINGIDKQLVGQFAANIRALKKPEPYKGKGIRYKGEYVRRKAGKAAKNA